jgi:hypothetical protein
MQQKMERFHRLFILRSYHANNVLEINLSINCINNDTVAISNTYINQSLIIQRMVPWNFLNPL